MPTKPLVATRLDGMGVAGLNTQGSAATLPIEYLTEASNVVFDFQGRIGPRKGIKAVSKTLANPIKSIGEYVKSDRTTEYYVGSGAAIYKRDTSTTPETLTAQSFSGSPQTISNSNWQWINFNNEFWGVQAGHKPINFDGTNWYDRDDIPASVATANVNGATSSTTTLVVDGNSGTIEAGMRVTGSGVSGTVTVSSLSDQNNLVLSSAQSLSDGVQITFTKTYDVPAGVTTFNPSCALGNFGRMWYGGITEDPGTVFYSDNLIGEKLTGGAAGSLDLRTVWGSDEIVAFGSLMDKLIIFGKNNIAIYSGASNPATMVLDELIQGVGLAGRDNIVYVGAELLFMSYEGLQSLGRITQTDGKAPITDLSIAVRNSLSFFLSTADLSTIKSVYHQEEGLVVTMVPANKLAYVFDFSASNKITIPKITTWYFSDAPLCGVSTVSGDLIMGLSSTIAMYDGYYDVTITDTTASNGSSSACSTAGGTWDGSKCFSTTNNLYNYVWSTPWLDFKEPNTSKILKQAIFNYAGGRGCSTTLQVFIDYDSTNPLRKVFNLAETDEAALYGDATSLYGTSKFAAKIGPADYKIPLSRTGKVLKLKMITEVVGDFSSLVSTTLLTKKGKTR